MTGRGNCFTVFGEFSTNDLGCVYHRRLMLSGCKTDDDIDDFQVASHGRHTDESADDSIECTKRDGPLLITVEQDGVIDRISE
jgi:hypothetical protein